jgi:hypothetical protein
MPAKRLRFGVRATDDRMKGLWKQVVGLPSLPVSFTVYLEHREGDDVKTVVDQLYGGWIVWVKNRLRLWFKLLKPTGYLMRQQV